MSRMDQSLLSTLHVTVVEAKGLPVADVGGKSDPYVVLKDVRGIKISGSGVKTSTKKKTLEPHWNETFPPLTFNYKLASLVFKCYDHDSFSKDDLLCKVKIPTEFFLDGQPKDQWFPMKFAGQGESSVAAGIHGSQGVPQLRLQLRADVRIPLVWPGQFVPVPGPQITLGLGWDVSKKQQVDLDASVVCLDQPGNIVDKIWYRNLRGLGGAIVHKGDNRTGEGDGDDEEVFFRLDQVPPHVVALVVLIDSYTKVPLTKVKSAYCRVRDTTTGQTFAFYRMSKMTDRHGLFFGCFYREAATGRFFFRTAAEPCDAGADAVPSLVHYLKTHNIV